MHLCSPVYILHDPPISRSLVWASSDLRVSQNQRIQLLVATVRAGSLVKYFEQFVAGVFVGAEGCYIADLFQSRRRLLCIKITTWQNCNATRKGPAMHASFVTLFTRPTVLMTVISDHHHHHHFHSPRFRHFDLFGSTFFRPFFFVSVGVWGGRGVFVKPYIKLD
jgi:hypothetical protein